MSDLTYKIKQSQTEPMRTGVMTSFNNLKEAQEGFRFVSFSLISPPSSSIDTESNPFLFRNALSFYPSYSAEEVSRSLSVPPALASDLV